MKMKILVIPFIVTIAVVFFIWLIYPAFSNGTDGIKENYANLKKEQEKLNELRDKNQNIENLSNQIATLPQKDILYFFIPEEAKEEEVVNGLNRLASESGLLLFDATVKQPEKNNTNVASLDSDLNGEEGEIKPQLKNFSTEIKLAGNYESIRKFLNSLGVFFRSNEVDSLEIGENASKGEAAAGSGALVANASINFNFLSQSKLNESSVSNGVFSSSQLETKIIDNIKSQRTANNFQLNVDQKGRSNLFQ